GLLGVDGRDGVPALVAAMKDPDEGVRRQAVRSLGEIGPPAADAVPVLIDAIQKPDLGADAVLALEGIGPAAVRSLGWALTDDSVAVRRAVAAVLRSIGRDAHEATPRLAAALKDPDAVVRLRAAAALGRIGYGARGAAAQLLEARSDRDDGVRDLA